jgi:hypothetical protein
MTESARQHNGIVGVSLSVLRSMVGQRIAHVGYKGLIDTAQGVGPTALVHEVDQAVVISTESTTMVLEWRIRNYNEFLSVVDSPSEAATAALVDTHDVSGLQSWSCLVGSVVTSFGIATQPSEEGRDLLWAVRIDIAGEPSVVVALGEVRGGMPNYQPDNLLVIFNAEVAQSYQVLGAAESAWGRDLYL